MGCTVVGYYGNCRAVKQAACAAHKALDCTHAGLELYFFQAKPYYSKGARYRVNYIIRSGYICGGWPVSQRFCQYKTDQVCLPGFVPCVACLQGHCCVITVYRNRVGRCACCMYKQHISIAAASQINIYIHTLVRAGCYGPGMDARTKLRRG